MSSPLNRKSILGVGVVLLVALAGVAIGAAGSAGAATADDAQPGFVVDLDDDGDATVTLVRTYDLSDADEQAAFEDLREDEDAQTQITDRYETRLQSVAEAATVASEREMSVHSGTVDFERADDTGIVRLTVRWDGLAAVDGEVLTLEEPFASGFVAEQPLTVTAPAGYELTDVEPEPTDRDEQTATWDAGTALDGFTLTASATDDGADAIPGFGVVAAALALLGLAALLTRRQ